MFAKVDVVIAALMKFSRSRLWNAYKRRLSAFLHLEQLHFVNRTAAADICLQYKGLQFLGSFSRDALVPACSHLQAFCQVPQGSKEYDFSIWLPTVKSPTKK